MVKSYGQHPVPDKSPLILTVGLEASAQQYFDELRCRYFPPERNFLHAHLTLFHALPCENFVIADVMEAARKQKVFSMKADSVVSIGQGTVIKIAASPLNLLHQQFQEKWYAFLTMQDKQKLWPHITIQNKVMPAEARKLQLTFRDMFEPFVFSASGLQLWKYLGGPWQAVGQFEFLKDDSKA